jgi:hypothetical protein
MIVKMHRRVTLSCVLGCCCLFGCQSYPRQATAKPAQTPQQVDYEIGPTLFPEGDSITIEDVHSSLGSFAKGDVVTIKGKYRLAGKSEAKLLLTITRTDSREGQSVQPEQTVLLKTVQGRFELSIDIHHKGYLDLSLRTASGEDRALGHTYFGTKEQMKEIADWNLATRFKK